MTIAHVKDVRDLLIATIAPEMSRARDSGMMRRRYLATDLDYDEATVAWVLDAITVRSLELLADLRRKQGGAYVADSAVGVPSREIEK